MEAISEKITASVHVARNFSTAAFLEQAIHLVEALERLHNTKTVYKTLTPHCFQIDPATHAVNLASPGTVRAGSYLEILTYSSPEQTGRTNRQVDLRTDYYSLGVILYEMVCGIPPFSSTDPMELLHGHLARMPAPPEQVNPQLPGIVGSIIMKLLAKRPEDRYQSDAGLLHDLQHCLNELQGGKSQIADFLIGLNDISDRLQIPQKLYGREKEIGLLFEVLDRTARGMPELILVTGYSGIGKSSLVQEIRAPIIGRRGYLLSGKFDQLKKSTPYSAIIQALDGFLKQILTESEEQLQNWRAEILAALGNSAQVFVELLPRLEQIIGKQPEVGAANPAEVQNRFNAMLQRFLRMLAKPEHPAALFLDDLQWADAASLKLIKFICADLNDASILLVGAYRDNEVDQTHPLTSTLDDIRAGKTPVHEIRVTPLPLASIEDMLADAFHKTCFAVRELAALIDEKTGGNPFFIHQFLDTLYKEKLIYLDGKRQWSWNIAGIKDLAITNNVVDLLSKAMSNFPQPTQLAISCAAAIGNSFTLGTLTTVMEQAVETTHEDLQPSVAAGLLIDLDALTDDVGLPDRNFRFLHDRVQQAAYELVKLGGKPALHYRIGQLLLGNTNIESLSDDKLFMLVEHLNCGVELITQSNERIQLARLNCTAAKKAKLSAAFAIAMEYLNRARDLLPENIWQSDYELAFNVYFETADIERLSLNYAKADALCEVVMANTQSQLHKAMVLELKLERYRSANNYQQAIVTGLEALALFGIDLPVDPTQEQYEEGLARMKKLELGKNIDAVLQGPVMTNPNYVVLTRIFASLLPCVWNGSPRLWPALIYEQGKILMENGHTGVCYQTYAAYAVTLSAKPETAQEGERIGRLAVAIAEKFGDTTMRNRAMLSYAAFYASWTRHLAETPPMLLEVYEYAANVGDIEYLNYALIFGYTHHFLIGTPLPKLAQLSRKYKEIFKKFGSNQYRLTYAIDRMIVTLSDKDADLIPDDFNQDEYLELATKTKNYTILFYYGAEKAMRCYLFGDPATAIEAADAASNLFWIFQSRALAPLLNLYHSLALLACCSDPEKRTAYLGKVEQLQKAMALWAANAPQNFAHKWNLVEAERQRVLGDVVKAKEHFDRAISGARRNGYLNDESVANELAGKFYLSIGDNYSARYHLEEACNRYREWGAYAKVALIDKEYGNVLYDERQQRQGESGAGSQQHSQNKAMDVVAITKASQALSSEIQLDTLLEKFMRIITENAGADTGFLILLRNDNLLVQARTAESEVTVYDDPQPVNRKELPFSLLNYVKRTLELLALDDIRLDSRFNNDPYILNTTPSSLLCVPIINREKLVGLLYLENRLISNVFSPERVELLQTLARQVAISMENAELYDSLEAKVEQRTLELSSKNRELQQAQKQLVESEKMASLGQLVAGIAHEINTPIGVSFTAATHFSKQTQNLTGKFQTAQIKKSDMTEYLSLAGETNEQLIANLSRASKLIQSFKQVAVDQSFDATRQFELDDYLNELILSLAPAVRKSGHSTQLSCPPGIVMKGYPGALAQVITNLIMNALAHAFEGIQGGIITISAKQFGDNIELNCQDNGVGIPEDILPKIFDPFFTTRRSAGGSGLGLHIAYNLVTQKLHGRIGCDSKVGAGAKFWLSLPIEIE
ncbi:MAG TPA: AAA family ATPase [Burkholderiaceae bacterium]|jgi:predicted ATPase/signal transduction histidine kinase